MVLVSDALLRPREQKQVKGRAMDTEKHKHGPQQQIQSILIKTL